jgi:predicted Zn-dependent protease
MASRNACASALAIVLFLSGAGLLAQTVVKPPKNKYTPKQDVELGRKAAAEVRREYPIITNDRITSYLTKLGDRLVAAAPPDLNEAVYEYSFTPVNLKEINAFALPGGPMFVNRGMIDAAASEGEVVGVMAHELSHVLLRHGTANVTNRRIRGCNSVRSPASSAAPSSRRCRIGDHARQRVRARHGPVAIQPRLREAGGSARHADHGAGRLRPARSRTCSKRSNVMRRATAAAVRSG